MSSSWVRVTSADNATRMPWTSGLSATNRPGFIYGHGSREASIFSGRSSSCVTWPLGHCLRVTDRTGSHTLRSRARTSTGLRIWASTIASSSASCGFIWVMPQCDASVSSRRFSVSSSRRRVSSTVHITVSTGSSAPTSSASAARNA